VRIIECDQGSEAWYAARCGVPSASNFDMILTTKGERSKQRQKYMYRLAGERVCGIPEEAYQSAAMARGKEMEAEAREFYEFAKGVDVRQVGFCMDDNAPFGASPDGLVGDDGCLEIKCPIIATHVGYLIENMVPLDYFQQTQGQLLVTGRIWCDFVSYYPGIKPLIIRVNREEPFIKILKSELLGFCEELETVARKIGG
jgi:putative phage-type endonuclease